MPSRAIFDAADILMTSSGPSYRRAVHGGSPDIGGASKSSSIPQGQIDDLEMRIERQNLLIQTLLMILLEKKVLHEDEFTEWMDYVDELDGVKDGRLKETKAPPTCPECKRRSPRSAVKCMYCGTEFPTSFLAQRREEG